ncbi:S2/P23 family protein [Borreliella lusitaniae]|uniref:S2/P23 family protein n=1 Tax=Borreliella lusitaniae TaxID=100177 RepID=UPI003C74E06E
MKKDISILNIFFFISFFYSCFLEPKSLKNIKTGISGFKEIKENNKKDIKENNKKDIKENNKKDIKENNKKDIKENNNNISYIDKEPKLTNIKEGEVPELLVGGYVTWAKSGNLINIKDKYSNLIEDLKGLKYSYIFSPIQFKTSSWLFSSYTYYINDNNYKILLGSTVAPIAKIIAFESTKEFEEKYEVKSLKLISAGSNIDFEQHRTGFAAIKLKETSKEPGYINSYNFGVFNNDLTNSFNLLWKKGEWSYMLAQLTIKDKQTSKNKTYEIVLSPKIFNDTIKLIYDKYPNLSKEKLKPPIYE